MDRLINQDQKLVQEGRKNVPIVPKADPKDRLIKQLATKLRDEQFGERVVQLWNAGNASRSEWLRRQEAFVMEFDEFLEPIYATNQDWQSALHMPVAFSICKAFHARMFAAIIGQDPPFTVTARKEANVDRAHMVQDLMRYAIRDWANNYKGLEEALDQWIWSWVTTGVGLMKTRWERKYTSFMDVDFVPELKYYQQQQDPDTGITVSTPVYEQKPKDVRRTVECFNGPMVDFVPHEDVLIVNGQGDVDKADAVLHSQFLTSSELYSYVDQGIFDEDEVTEVIRGGEQTKSSEPANLVKQTRADSTGIQGPDVTHDLDRYQIIEAYLSKDVDGSGVNSEIVVWVHKMSMRILRATYLYRITKSVKRPFAKIDFHKREDQDYGVGLPELIYSLTKEIDAIHNMRIDFGLLSTMPFGYYRATSSMQQEKIPIEPGTLVPLDNPQSDVYFPNLGNRTVFGFQEEQSLMSMVERVTSMTDMSFGMIGGQGATRTATGARAVVNEANANLDIFLRRLNRGFKKVLHSVFAMLQEKLPPGLEFRILGDDGNAYWRKFQSRAELEGNFDFELEPNSANSNKQVQIDTAQQMMQLTSNPLDIQLGIITPQERYEALRNYAQALGVKDWSRYFRKPQNASRAFLPIEIANRVLAGIDVVLDPSQDLQGFVALFQDMLKDDQVLGQFNEEQTIMLARKAAEAQQMLTALKQMAAQQANSQQMQNNANQSTQQTNPGGPIPGVASGQASNNQG